MTTIQERLAAAEIEVKPLGHILRDEYARLVVKNEADYTARILATPEALAASPEVQALIAAAETRVSVDPVAIEAAGKRWHGEDHRVVAVRWEPYKPDGARQMKAKGRWQEMVGSGDYWRWQNCERPAALRSLKKEQ